MFLSDWIYFLAMTVEEGDLFFNYSKDFKLIEQNTEIIHCGRSDRDLIKSVKNIQKLVAIGSATLSKSEL